MQLVRPKPRECGTRQTFRVGVLGYSGWKCIHYLTFLRKLIKKIAQNSFRQNMRHAVAKLLRIRFFSNSYAEKCLPDLQRLMQDVDFVRSDEACVAVLVAADQVANATVLGVIFVSFWMKFGISNLSFHLSSNPTYTFLFEMTILTR